MEVDQVISPELVLVGPEESRASALAALPEREPDAFLIFDRSDKPRRHPELDRLAFLADDSESEQASLPGRSGLVVKATAYGLLSLVQQLLVWCLVLTTLITGAVLVAWIT
ncbi:MAG: hypothetical protein ACXVHL_37525 [Solirubrobacteraceae bacterium]